MRARQDREAGHVMVLMIGYVLLVLLVVTVVAAAGSLYLGQKRLLSLADGAALAAADTFVLSGTGTADPGTLLTRQSVVQAAENHVAGMAPPTGLSGIALGPGTGAPDGHTAQVTVTGVVHPLFINFLVPAGIAVTVTSTARANLAL